MRRLIYAMAETEKGILTLSCHEVVLWNLVCLTTSVTQFVVHALDTYLCILGSTQPR